jgi:hypothetical protein
VWLLALGVLPGCDPWVVGDGVFKEEVRPVTAFTAVSVQDGIDVQVVAGSAQRSLSVSGDDNVLDHVKTTVKSEGGTQTLVVEADVAHLEATLPLLVSVTTPDMTTAVTATGESRVDVSGATAAELTVSAGSGATVTLAGAGGDRLVLTLWGGQGGGASLDARSYIVDEVVATLSGGSLAQVHADESVSGTASEGSTLLNVGEGTCQVAASSGASVVCMD